VVFKIIFLSAVGDGSKNFYALSPILLKIFYRHRRQRLKFFTAVADSASKCLVMSVQNGDFQTKTIKILNFFA
jgi:hypothetical protein